MNVTVPFLVELASGETQEQVESELPSTPQEWMDTFRDAWALASENLMPRLPDRTRILR